MSELTHFDENGNAVMVDVSKKSETERIAIACSSISVSKETLDESPFAYKNIDDIIPNILPTVDIIKIIKPIYNFKAV